MLIWLLLLFILELASGLNVTITEPLNFSFSSFGPDACSQGHLLCSGATKGDGGFLRLTPKVDGAPALDTVGRVLFYHPVLVWPAIFTTTFTVSISPYPNSTVYGDGMAFFISPDNSSAPLGSSGSYLGLMNATTSGTNLRQLAVELDTYKNEWDPDDNHIGIDTKSIINPITAKTLKNTGVDLKSGEDITVKIHYHGWKKRLQVWVAYSGNPLMSLLNQSIDLSTIVPSKAYLGFTAATGKAPECHRILDWTFVTKPLPYLHTGFSSRNAVKATLCIVLPMVTGFIAAFLAVFPAFWRDLRRRTERAVSRGDIESRARNAANVPKMFSYKQLCKATQNFSNANLLGAGGFGSVYKAVIESKPPVIVAVKKISATSRQGEREYFAEICTIGRLRHKNIVQLQGWCHEREQLLLVYDFMPNGSLDRYIGGAGSSSTVLDWPTRYKILTGLASALLYLHEESGNPVVHRDVKPSNVMLDSGFNAHLGDFGLARLLGTDDASVTTMLAGTPGYMAPEVGFTGRATPESDVYAFGMVVLEVVCGRKSKAAMEENSLVDLVWKLLGENAILECVDESLGGGFDEEQARRSLVVGLASVHPDAAKRPRMRKVIQVFLNPEEPLMELPETRPLGVFVSMSSSPATSVTVENFASDIFRTEESTDASLRLEREASEKQQLIRTKSITLPT